MTDDPRPFPARPGADNDEIDEVFGSANPNPERIGCPPRSELERLARQRGAIDDPLYEHLASCSPCFRDWRAMQATAQRQSATLTTRSLLVRRPLAAAAVLIALMLAGLLWWNWETTVQSNRTNIARHDTLPEIGVSLDLRPYAVARGDATTAVTRPLLLRGRVMRITMILPVGAEPGPYDIQILDQNLHSLITVRAAAELRDQVTQLHTTLDLSALPEGAYQLALRRDDQDWRFFPAEVRTEQPKAR
jgi:hypothetical protein